MYRATLFLNERMNSQQMCPGVLVLTMQKSVGICTPGYGYSQSQESCSSGWSHLEFMDRIMSQMSVSLPP